MKKHQKYFVGLCVIILLYNFLHLLFNNEQFIQFWQKEKRPVSLDYLQWILSVLPWYSLICFGCYCLTKLGLDVLNFNDCPHEIQKMTQVEPRLFLLMCLTFFSY